MLEDFLSKLGASTRITVGVAVSPGVGLEMIEVDRLTGTVNKYSCKPLEYNNSTREIMDYDMFRIALEELFEELHIPKRSNIVLSLPNVHFGIAELPMLLTDEAVTNALISEVEQSYIFKRLEPTVSWFELHSNVNTETKTYAYSAIQKEAMAQITEICDEIGCSIVAVENSYSSLFRALNYTSIAKEQMKENTAWNLVVIMQNNYSIFSMNGKRVVEYTEEPLALKSFVDDEIYNAIKASAQLTLSNLPANYLYIISETDLVSAEVLSMKLSADCPIKFLECNKFVQNELLPVNLNILPKLALQITPEAIGTAAYHFCDYPLKLNAANAIEGEFTSVDDSEDIARVNIGNLEVELTPAFIKKLALIAGSILLVPITLIFLIFGKVIIPKEQARLQKMEAKIETLNADIQKYQDTSQNATFDLKSAVDKIVLQNKTKLSYYGALGASVPNKLWITEYTLKGENKVDIKGQASEVQSIYAFYKGIKQLVNNSDIRLYKLEINSASIDDFVADTPNSSKLYEFEITNMSEAELAPKASGNQGAQAPGAPQAPVEETKNQGFQIGKPLFGINKPNEQQNQPPAPTPPTTPGPQGEQLPQNLKKIEKF